MADQMSKGRRVLSAPEREILIMPTFRKDLVWERPDDRGVLERSAALGGLHSLLSSPTLRELLFEVNARAIYLPHPRLEKFSGLFNHLAYDGVEIESSVSTPLRILIGRANLLLTDFSSVAFDFAYQRKPVVYYQPDVSYYRRKHYKEGYFDYDKHGFGPVASTVTTAVSLMKEVSDSNFRPTDTYRQRMVQCFPKIDTNNSARVLKSLERHPLLAIGSGA
jgi:CDP-glycerol glycerophosphotransferase (TagB/SpsB family)